MASFTTDVEAAWQGAERERVGGAGAGFAQADEADVGVDANERAHAGGVAHAERRQGLRPEGVFATSKASTSVMRIVTP